MQRVASRRCYLFHAGQFPAPGFADSSASALSSLSEMAMLSMPLSPANLAQQSYHEYTIKYIGNYVGEQSGPRGGARGLRMFDADLSRFLVSATSAQAERVHPGTLLRTRP